VGEGLPSDLTSLLVEENNTVVIYGAVLGREGLPVGREFLKSYLRILGNSHQYQCDALKLAEEKKSYYSSNK